MCQLVKPAFCPTVVGVNNLPTVVAQLPASAGFEPVSFKRDQVTQVTVKLVVYVLVIIGVGPIYSHQCEFASNIH